MNNEILVQDAQNLIEEKILPIDSETFRLIARPVSVSVRAINMLLLGVHRIVFFPIRPEPDIAG